MATHPELQTEQAYIDQAYARLDDVRAALADRLGDVLGDGKGTPQAVLEREIVVNNTLHRLDHLDIGDQALCFGRIDEDDGERFYIGRLAVSGTDQEPLIVDWRAPIAEPFYRATGREPMGLRRRRHFATEGRRLMAIEDEVFHAGADGDGDGGSDTAVSNGDGGDRLDLVGPGALLAALERSRSGYMRDIVATVQREQDEVIRAPLPGVLIVQGGPGTGKTAVALHRAAYLLYTHRFPLERQGVLVVGPNRVFLRYIEHVLPSLGESGAALASVESLVPGVGVQGVESRLAARTKGDVRMAEVLARAVRTRQRGLPHTVEVPFGAFVLRVPPEVTAQIVAGARRRAGPHNARRRYVETQLVRRLETAYATASGQDLPDDREERGGWHDELRRRPEVIAALDRMWPILTPAELLHDLFGAPALLRQATRDLLSDDERDALARPRSTAFDAIPWTAADIALLDEAAVLLGPRRTRPGVDGGPRSYGHIVVDEAQDLSPMQLRMLARRSLAGSMTVVGDLAQGSGEWAHSSWDEVLAHLPVTRGNRIVELSVNYRTPAEIMALAGRVLAATVPGARPPQSVRETGIEPAIVAAEADALSYEVARAACQLSDAVRGGTVAVVCPPSLVERLRTELHVAEVPFGEPDTHGLDAPVTLLPVSLARGLEFDGVVVVEPAAIVRESPQGLRGLFVAVTRATQRLTMVHAEPLPDVLVTPAVR